MASRIGPIPPPARRLAQLPPYLFVQIDALKHKLVRQGKDVIDMGVGDPDEPTPRFILEAMVRALQEARNHRYPSNRGLESFRSAIARWYRERFGVRLDPATEILPLIGSKEGIAHLPLAYVNPGDRVLVPDPCYPPYRTGTILAGGRPVPVPLLARNRFLPDLEALRRKAAGAKLFFLNYPNNPTAAVADLAFFRELVRFARRVRVPVCHDAAYSELTFDGLKHPSFLQVPGASEVGIEFHSLSKTFNMTGWRVGWVCGNREMIGALTKVKSNIDSGVFQAIQIAGIRALQAPDTHLKRMLRIYAERRDILVAALRRSGWPVTPPKATFYLWAPIPKGRSSKQVSTQLLRQAAIVATPGVGFGRSGEGYVRFSLSVPTARVREAARRIQRLSQWLASSLD
ncbi:MAG: LL-diaminopimelate aminotransferase [Candidatus Omnitrophica bacterium]|nr:LL-diaminopimelate aminotransferase [Candidatus Omnitrophota bacterium]